MPAPVAFVQVRLNVQSNYLDNTNQTNSLTILYDQGLFYYQMLEGVYYEI